MQPAPEESKPTTQPGAAEGAPRSVNSAPDALASMSLPSLPAQSQSPAPSPLPEFSTLLCKIEDGLMQITMNRPQSLNSISLEMGREMSEAVKIAATRDDVKVVLISGSGRAFCSGQELSAEVLKSEILQDLGKIVRETYNPLISTIRNAEKPFICAVNGIAAGAGATLALACDLVIAARDASFVQSFSKIGLIPDGGGTYTLPRLVGPGRALGLMMLADKVSADEALAMGMIYKVVDPAALTAESLSIAKRLGQQPAVSLGLIKRAVNATFQNSLEDQLELEAKLQTQAGHSEDFREGVSAFLQKRKPQFKGK